MPNTRHAISPTPSDRLPAISAVAREVAKLAQTTYLAGLWKEDLHRGLLWSYDGVDLPFLNYLAPSWSWSSVIFRRSLVTISNGCRPYNFYHWNSHASDLEPEAEILDCSIVAADRDVFDKVISGYLVIRSACIEAVGYNGALGENVRNELPRFKQGNSRGQFSWGEAPKNYITCVLDHSKHNGRYTEHWADFVRISEKTRLQSI